MLVRESIRVPNKLCKPHDRNRAEQGITMIFEKVEN